MSKPDLAIAYSIKRKNAGKKPKKMAEGGAVSAATEKRPMPETKGNDAAEIARNSGKKAPSQDSVTSRPDIKQSQKGPKTQPIKHPKMVPINGANLRLRDQEDHLQSSAKPNEGPQEQPPKAYDEKGANRQGPDVPALHMKKMAKGGMINNEVSMARAEEDNAEHPAGLEETNSSMAPPQDEYMADHMMPLAEGGMAHDEIEDQLHDSIAAAIMARRDRMANGGKVNGADSIYVSDSDQADLSRNAEEDANMEDQASYDALRKENYSESAGLAKLDQPEDSNQHGHELSDEDAHSMVEAIRRKMAARRQFSK